MKRPARDKSKVSITEKPPDADRIIQELIKNPTRLPETIRQLIKPAARLLKAKRPFVEANQDRQDKAAAKYRDIRKIASELIAADARLSRKPYVLADRVRKRLIKQGKLREHKQGKKVSDGYSIKTIVRALE